MFRLREVLHLFTHAPRESISGKKIKSLLVVQLLFHIGWAFGWVLFVPWIFKLGFTELDYLFYFIALWAFTIPMLLVRRRMDAGKSMARGLLARAATFLVIMHFFTRYQIFIVSLLIAIIIVEFWVAFNTLYESRAPSKERAFLNSVLMLVAPLTSAALPALAGFVAEAHGFEWVFLGGAVFVLASAVLASRIKGLGKVELDPVKAFRDMRPTEPFVFLQGFWEGVNYAAIPLVTFSLVATTFDYAWFFAYLGLVGAVAALVFGRLSDVLHGRVKFLSTIMVFMGLACMAAGLSWDYFSWAVFIGLVELSNHVARPFLLTVVTDVSRRKVNEAMLVREYFLNTGRTLGAIVLLGCFLYLSIKAALFAAGFAMVLYPVVLLYEKRTHLRSLF